MHTSRLAALIIDCQIGSLDMAAQFWSAALGRDLKPPKAGDDRYRGLESTPFCVVKSQRGAMVLNAKTWPSETVLSFDGGAEHAEFQKMVGHYHGETKTWLWGWRMEFHRGDKLIQKAFNISPSGIETPASETEWTR